MKKEKQGRHSPWNIFSSLKFTIFLMVFLALISIIGTIIPQNVSLNEYLRIYDHSTYNVLNKLGFLDVYHCWWFISILILLCLNLLFCSIRKFPQLWKTITKDNAFLNDDHVQRLPLSATITTNFSLEEIKEKIFPIIKKHFGSPRESSRDGVINFFIEKAKYSRLGVYIVHASVILILIGGLIGSLFGFKATISILEGESADQVILQKSSLAKKLGFEIRCDDFEITYYPDGTPKDYKSALTVLEGDEKILSKTIEVNHPLKYRGIVFYQSSYGITADQEGKFTITAKREGNENATKEFQVENGESFSLGDENLVVKVHRFYTYFIMDETGKAINQSPAPKNPALELLIFRENTFQKKILVFQKFPEFPASHYGPYQFFFKDFPKKMYTGLQVTKDPGVDVVWAGCILMMVGIVFTFFFSHRQLWVRIIPREKKSKLIIAGTADKNRIAFEKEFRKLTAEIESDLQPEGKKSNG